MSLNSAPSTVSVETLNLKIEAAKDNIYVDVGFWGGLVPENALNSTALESFFRAGDLGLKSFMCPSGINDFPITNISHIKEGLTVLAKFRRPLLIHAEIQLENDDNSITEANTDSSQSYAMYLRSRPASMEEGALRELSTVTKDTRTGGPAEEAHVHVVHQSDAGASLNIIKAAKDSSDSISVETCPHYLAFSAKDIPDGETRFKCSPPIRDSICEGGVEQFLFCSSSCISNSILLHEAGREHSTLVQLVNAELWIRIPSVNPSLPMTFTPVALIMSRIAGCELLLGGLFSKSGFKALLEIIDQYSAVEKQSNCFLCDVPQFLQLKNSSLANPLFPSDESSVSLMEIKVCANASSLWLCQSSDSNSLDMVANLDMASTLSVSLQNEYVSKLDIYFSSLVLHSLVNSVTLVKCISDSSVSSALMVRFVTVEEVRGD